jgi:GTP cyclohydrolase II
MKNDNRAHRPTISGAVSRYAETILPTRFGDLRCIVYRRADGLEQVAMVAGDVTGEASVLCRVHSECMTSEVFGSLKCDCREQLDAALERIAQEGRGVVIYLRQEGRGIGLGNKIRAYALQEEGFDTVDANRELGLPDDARDYRDAATILQDLGVTSIALMTNNPLKVEGMQSLGINVARRESHVVNVKGSALRYVETKQARMGHFRGPSRSLHRVDC